MSPEAITIGISGLSSSGKTTLSRLLCRIFPNTFILHQDDFYVADSAIPIHNGLADWDCLESIDYTSMARAIQHIRSTGKLPEGLKSIENQNPVGKPIVKKELVEELENKVKVAGVAGVLEKVGRKIAVVDGFLLFHEGSEVEELFDVRILLRAPYEKAKQRREARNYATIEGWWEDPPGYFDKIVWPSYVQAHKSLFVNDDITGVLKPEVVENRRIRTVPDMELPMEQVLRWAVDLLIDEVKSLGIFEGSNI